MAPDRELLGIFSDEQAEHIGRIRALLGSLTQGGPEAIPAITDELLRRGHTLKGAARAVGLPPTELLSHGLESAFSGIRSGTVAIDSGTLGTFEKALNAAEDALAAAIADRPGPDVAEILRELQQLAAAPGVTSPAPAVVDPGGEPPVTEESAEAVESTPPAPPEKPVPAMAELVRVNAGTLDEVIRGSSQLLALTNASGTEGAEAERHAQYVDETVREYQRLRRNSALWIRRHDKEPEAVQVAECLAYVDSRIGHLLSGSRTLLASQRIRDRRIRQGAEELHDNALRARMTPADSVFSGFGTMVRELAREVGKKAELRSEGMEVQADRLVLQALRDPVMHLLRNAVSHGIETERERSAGGKDPAGSIRLRIVSRGDRLTVLVEDDGKGLNQRAVAEEAARRGLVSDAAKATRSAEELSRLVFQPGFSTARVITSLSGRGMGLSVVHETVKNLQGDVSLRPRPGGGTVVAISVPLSISTQHVLLMEAGGHTFGVPVSYLERLHRGRLSDVKSVNGRESMLFDNMPVPLGRLTELLGLSESAFKGETTQSKSSPILQIAVIASGDERIALVVDQLTDEREAVVKELGLPPSATGLTAGGVPLDDGSVAVMLNVPELISRFHEHSQTAGPRFSQSDAAEPTMHRILVVDDSATTRSLEKSILEAYGYRVDIAVDGLEALGKVRAHPPDLVISDVMMPQMTGFELLGKIKEDPRLAHIPVILVTSLERRDEQEMGLALGADAYIVKRRFDQRDLLSTVRQIL